MLCVVLGVCCLDLRFWVCGAQCVGVSLWVVFRCCYVLVLLALLRVCGLRVMFAVCAAVLMVSIRGLVFAAFLLGGLGWVGCVVSVFLIWVWAAGTGFPVRFCFRVLGIWFGVDLAWCYVVCGLGWVGWVLALGCGLRFPGGWFACVVAIVFLVICSWLLVGGLIFACSAV